MVQNILHEEIVSLSEKVNESLISFGKYLLSKERNKDIDYQLRFDVTHADLCNWKDSLTEEK